MSSSTSANAAPSPDASRRTGSTSADGDDLVVFPTPIVPTTETQTVTLPVTSSRYDPAAMYTTPFGIALHSERLPCVAGVTMRHAETRDVARLNDFLNHYIVNTAINFVLEPFTLQERAEWLRSYHTTGRHQMVVAEADGVLLGLASTGQFRPKHAYDTTVEVSVVCAPEAVGFG